MPLAGFWGGFLPWEGAIFALRFNASNAITHLIKSHRPGLYFPYSHSVCDYCTACDEQGDLRRLGGPGDGKWFEEGRNLYPKPVEKVVFVEYDPPIVVTTQALERIEEGFPALRS
jgi:hypothetical protein